MRFVIAAGGAPAGPGAYALWLRLAAPLAVKAGPSAAVLSPGDYLYCGSANGSGGLRARLARHMRKEKRAHWHVDQLTAAGEVLGAFLVEGGDECALNAALSDLPAPLPGFGSSDCPRCVSHLRYFPPGARLPSVWENARKAAESHLPLEGGGRPPLAAGRGQPRPRPAPAAFTPPRTAAQSDPPPQGEGGDAPGKKFGKCLTKRN